LSILSDEFKNKIIFQIRPEIAEITPCMSGSKPNDNGYRRKPAFVAWASLIDARRLYSRLSDIPGGAKREKETG